LLLAQRLLEVVAEVSLSHNQGGKSRDVIVVPPELDLQAAWRLMEREKIRHLVVLRGSGIVGIVSDRDILARGLWRHGTLELDPKLMVVNAMSPTPYTVSPRARVSEVARLMVEKQIDAVPVVDAEERVVGLVTSTDLLALIADSAGESTIPFAFRMRDDAH
jgi:acetoin utilization protein AcuB